MSLRLAPMSWAEAADYVTSLHRHNAYPPDRRGHRFSVAVIDDDYVIHGVAMAHRPVARAMDDGWTLEVARTCTDETKNVNSMLYGAIRRAAKALGYTKLITYTRDDEPGTSLRAAGWQPANHRAARGEDWGDNRPRTTRGTGGVGRTRWEAVLDTTS